MALIRKFNKFKYENTGLKYIAFNADNGGITPKAFSQSIEILHESGELIPVSAKVAVYLKQDKIEDADSEQGCITEGQITSITKIDDYRFTYTISIENDAAALGLNGQPVTEVALLDYDHYILPVEKNGTTSFITYYFDNLALDEAIAQEKDYYAGSASTPFAGAQYKDPKYPIVDFFDRKFTQTLENDAIVWVRAKGNGGADTITYKDSSTNKFTIGSDANFTGNPEYPDAYYIQVAESRTSYDATGDMTPSIPKDVQLGSTTAKFIGWPSASDNEATDELVIENASPFYFLKPEGVVGVDGSAWDDDGASATFVINGAHQVSPESLNGMVSVSDGGDYDDDYWTNGHMIVSGNNQGQLVKTTYTGSVDATDYSSQRVMSVGGAFIPGDGNEFYNIEFYRNDGVATEGVVKVETRQGIIFDNCKFTSEWDGYKGKATGDVVDTNVPYIGTSQLGSCIKVSDAFDITFKGCEFNRKSAYVLGAIDWPTGQVPQLDSIVVGQEASYGKVPAVDAKKSGNLTFDGCSGINSHGQTVFQFDDVDNLDMENCISETYYQGTPKGSREVIDKPIGYLVNNNSTSMWLKGCSFYGEGIGFYVENLKEMVYPLIEDCSAIANGEEAFYFREVKYPKLRNCKGETISKNVFLFEGCEDPILFNCTAESDTGYGFAFKTIEFSDYITKPSTYWRTNDCHILSGSGLTFDETSLPGKIDFGTFIQTANIYKEIYGDVVVSDRSLVGLKLWDAPYKTTIRNMYFKNIVNDVDIDKGPNVELYLENTHFAGIKEIEGEYNSPAYFIHKGFSGVWEYRDIGGSITTSAVKLIPTTEETTAGYVPGEFSLSFKSSVNNELGRPSITLGNSNEETQYLDLTKGTNKITIYVMTRLLDVENPLTDLGLWAEVKYKDRSPGDPHIATATTRGRFDDYAKLTEDTEHISSWMISNTMVPDSKAYKIEFEVVAGQDCSAPLTICYEHYTTVGEVYVAPYAKVETV